MQQIIEQQKQWSQATFGPGPRTKGIIAHIRKELAEIEADPADIMEWADFLILTIDGAWRAGWEAESLAAEILEYKASLTWASVDRLLKNNHWDRWRWAALAACAIGLAGQHGHTREALLAAVVEKQRINREDRIWPGWRECGEDEAIEHQR